MGGIQLRVGKKSSMTEIGGNLVSESFLMGIKKVSLVFGDTGTSPDFFFETD